MSTRMKHVEKWDIFEFSTVINELPRDPFEIGVFTASFENDERLTKVTGFYDGGNRFILRFMPTQEGDWTMVTHSQYESLDGLVTSFICVPPGIGNRGPVHPVGRHFHYADGSPFLPVGTTAYTWAYQDELTVARSLETFSKYGFNKIRMLFFPKEYGRPEDKFRIDFSPEILPFEGVPGNLDFQKPNPVYFRLYETRIRQLMDREIEAELILFHVYDSGRWGIPGNMTPKDDDRFLNYIVARMSAFRNIWWSLANEYDLFGISQPFQDTKPYPAKNWDHLGESLMLLDPYDHPRSIHNWTWGPIYPDRIWMSHVSYQHPNSYSLGIRLAEQYGKPVINDEYQYEGNLPNDFGNCSPELETKRHWMAAMAGTYATHGEMYAWPDEPSKIFWATGGTIEGDSPTRIRYMKKLISSLPFEEYEPDLRISDGVDFFTLQRPNGDFISFFGPGYKDRPNMQIGHGDEMEREYKLEIHDVWRCKVVDKTHALPGPTTLSMPRWAVVIGEVV